MTKGFNIGYHVTKLLQLRDFYRLKGARPDLQQLLFSSKDALATDPRDKIYGVLGLRDIGAPEINIVPDYELSACRVRYGHTSYPHGAGKQNSEANGLEKVD